MEDARKEMLGIIQNRELPIKERAMLVLAMAHDMQGRINRGAMFECEAVIEKYKTEKARNYIANYLAQKDRVAEEKLTREMFENPAHPSVIRYLANTEVSFKG